jgi:hypothetical protein
MTLGRSPPRGHVTPAFTLLAALVPVVGVALFGWRAAEILAVYWVEVAAVVAGHSVAALFAERPIRLEDRSFYITGYSKRSERDPERWAGEPEPIGLVDRVIPDGLAERPPPMYRRNVSVVTRSLGVVGFLLFGAIAIADSLAVDLVAVATTPAVVLAAVAVSFGQLAEIRRTFFFPRQYEAWSAYMTVEAAQRVVVFYVAVGLLAVPVAFVGLLVGPALLGDAIAGSELVVPGVGPFRPAASVDPLVLAYVLPFALAKATVDRSRRLASSRSDPTGFTAWFLPEDPRSE